MGLLGPVAGIPWVEDCYGDAPRATALPIPNSNIYLRPLWGYRSTDEPVVVSSTIGLDESKYLGL